MSIAAPIRALDKRLRDGRRLVIDLVPQSEFSIWSYWIRATVDEQITQDRFYAPVERGVTNMPDLPHVITIQFLEPGPDGYQRYVSRAVGLTDAEADAIDAAIKEWTQRHVRRALTAAPDAPTWRIDGFTTPPLVGAVVHDHDRDEPVVVLKVTSRWIPEDGRSFHLDAEEGYLHTATVRALTPQERAEWDTEQARQQRIADAYTATSTLFGWIPKRHEWPADAERVENTPAGDKLYLSGTRLLVRANESIYARTYGADSLANGVVQHPATPERVEVFDVLMAASQRGHLH